MSVHDLLRVAAERGFVVDATAWFTYRQMRNITAHAYDHAKAEQVCRGPSGFLADAEALIARLEALNG